MDRIQEIGLSKISDVLSSGTLVIPNLDMWKRIFLNAGQSELYSENVSRLRENEREKDWRKYYENNDRTYSALVEILKELTGDSIQFVKWLNSYFEKAFIINIFKDNVEKEIDATRLRISGLEDFLRRQKTAKCNEWLSKFPSREFRTLRSSLNMLGYDVEFGDELILRVAPLALRNEEEQSVKSAMIEWLESNYPSIIAPYENAIKMYCDGNPVECLSDCRNVITGIFTYHKNEGTKWLTGLQHACKADKNILNVTPSNIPTWKNGMANAPNQDQRYNYPRFKTIHQIYSFLSDLGPHKEEGNVVNGIVDCEITSMEDAMLGLRMTESIIIWLYQNQTNDL